MYKITNPERTNSLLFSTIESFISSSNSTAGAVLVLKNVNKYVLCLYKEIGSVVCVYFVIDIKQLNGLFQCTSRGQQRVLKSFSEQNWH